MLAVKTVPSGDVTPSFAQPSTSPVEHGSQGSVEVYVGSTSCFGSHNQYVHNSIPAEELTYHHGGVH